MASDRIADKPPLEIGTRAYQPYRIYVYAALSRWEIQNEICRAQSLSNVCVLGSKALASVSALAPSDMYVECVRILIGIR